MAKNASDSAVEAARRRLRWRCRRGLLELDVWLERFANESLENLTSQHCELLERLLREADADILAWLQGQQAVPPAYEQMLSRIRMAV